MFLTFSSSLTRVGKNQIKRMISKTLASSLVLALGVTFLPVVGAEKVDVSKLPPPSDKKGVTYDKDIKPIFEKSCFKCHGPDKQKSKLRLDSLAAVVKGGENG